jgi:hypothetical protein
MSKLSPYALMLILVCFVSAGLAAESKPAAPAPPIQPAQALTGRQIAEKINAVDQGTSVRQTLVMTLTDSGGSSQERRTLFMGKRVPGLKKSVIYFLDPAKLKGTGFLTYDYTDEAAEDAQWLYLPAMQRTRRITASDRGSYFLGTDFTYEDIKNQTRLSLTSFDFTAAGEEVIDGVKTLLVDAKPLSPKIADELGYSRVRLAVDPALWIAIRAEYWDTGGNPLKTTRLYDIKAVQGITAAQRAVVENHKTGHKTEFRFENIQYDLPLSDDDFTEDSLRRGYSEN